MLTARWAPWLYCQPGVRRAWLLTQMLWGGALLALLTAPRAAAAGVSNALSWSDLKDSRGIPIGAYYISTVDIAQAMQAQGADLGWDPSTWVPALTSRLSIALSYSFVAGALGMCCGFLLLVCAVGIWLVKFALSTNWLMWLAAIATPIVASINQVLGYLHVIPTALTICLFIGGVIALTKGVGRGIGIMGSGFVVILLASWLLRDPVTHLASPNGILGTGRWLGFSVSMGVANNGPITTNGSDINEAQVNVLAAWMTDVLVRQHVQLINFGQVIDDIPGCAAAWDNAVMGAVAGSPVEAMKTCGATDAYHHAEHLTGESVGLFVLLNLVVLAVLMAICYVGAEVLRIGFKAFWNVLILVPAAAVAVAPGPQRRFAKKTALKAIVHGIEMMFSTGGLGVLLILMSHVIRGSIGGMSITHPVLKLVVLLLLTWAGALAFRKLLHGFGDAGLPTPWSFAKQAVSVAAPMAALRMSGTAMREHGRAWGPHDNSQLPGAADEGTRGPRVAGRRAHPPVDARRQPSADGHRPPSHGDAAASPPPRRPSGGPGGSDGGATAVPTPLAAPTGSSMSAARRGSAAAGGAASAAAAAVAPEVMVAGAVAQKVSDAVARHRDTPGRSNASTDSAVAAAPGVGNQDTSAASGPRTRSAPSRPQHPPPAAGARQPAQQPTPPPAPPQRTPPRPSAGQE